MTDTKRGVSFRSNSILIIGSEKTPQHSTSYPLAVSFDCQSSANAGRSHGIADDQEDGSVLLPPSRGSLGLGLAIGCHFINDERRHRHGRNGPSASLWGGDTLARAFVISPTFRGHGDHSMARDPDKNTGVPVPNDEPYLFIEEAATLLETTRWGIINRIRRGLIPTSCIIQDRPGARILLDKAKLLEVYPPRKRGLRRRTIPSDGITILTDPRDIFPHRRGPKRSSLVGPSFEEREGLS